MSEKSNLMVNRILFLLAGVLVMFAMMSFTVVTNFENENATLTSALDTSRYEAGRLLADAGDSAGVDRHVQDFLGTRADLADIT